MSTPAGFIRFRLNGQEYQLGRAAVDSRVGARIPEEGRTHLVRVQGRWFPVKQAFEAAVGVSRAEFTSQTARRHLAALGYELSGAPQAPASTPDANLAEVVPLPGASDDWHTEENVQAMLVSWLVSEGWQILSVANTATREHGVDIVARHADTTMGVEVKGFPSRTYSHPSRAGELKRTSPSTQAGHWFAAAVLAAMRLRGRNPDHLSAIALPDFPRYRALYDEVVASLSAVNIQVFWVTESGNVTRAVQHEA